MPVWTAQWDRRAVGLLRLKALGSHVQLRQLAIVGLSIGGAQVLMALGGVVTAHALGPQGKGIVTVVTTWGQMLGWLFLVGLDTASCVRVAASKGDATGNAVGNAVLYALVVGGVAGCASALVLSTLLARLGADAHVAAAIGMATIPVEILSTVLQSINLGLGRTRQFNLARLTAPSVLILALLLMWAGTGLTPLRAIVATLGGSVAALMVAGWRLPWRQVTLELKALRSDLSFGVRLLPAGLLSVANARLDVLLMSLAVSANQIGLYSVANNFGMPATVLGSAMMVLITPAVARMAVTHGDGPIAAAQHQIEKIVHNSRLNLAVGTPLALGIAILAPALLPFVFGSAFIPAVLLLWILMPGNVARSYAVTVSAGASGMRQTWVGNVAEGAGFVVTALLLPLLMWRNGIVGAAVASTCSYFASAAAAALSLEVLRRRIKRGASLAWDSSGASGSTEGG